MNVKEVQLQYFKLFFNKKTPGGAFKNEMMQNNRLAE